MANFQAAYAITKKNEGGYASAAYAKKIGDRGGETYKGHARNFSLDWPGWKIVDDYKAKFGLPKYNTYITAAKEPYKGAAAELDKLVEDRYKTAFWNVVKGDSIKDQAIANILFDIGVNSGPGTAALTVQHVLNLTQDASIGPATLKAINSMNAARLLHMIGEYRIEWLKVHQKGKVYLESLIDRVNRYLTAYEKPVAGVAIVLGLGLGFFLLSRVLK